MAGVEPWQVDDEGAACFERVEAPGPPETGKRESYMYIRTHKSLYVCICMYKIMYISIHIHICIDIYIERERERGKTAPNDVLVHKTQLDALHFVSIIFSCY